MRGKILWTLFYVQSQKLKKAWTNKEMVIDLLFILKKPIQIIYKYYTNNMLWGEGLHVKLEAFGVGGRLQSMMFDIV